ncbi:MAG: CbiX/SirB N-terminal domain-containing protein [Thermostichales cyanobacterium SZTDM-1c_bins_54]
MFYLLVGHGSGDPRYQAVLAWCIQHSQMALAPVPVRGATLEHHPLPLSEQILAHARQLEDLELKLIPLFMGSGVHLATDIPEQVARAHQRQPHLRVHLTPALGSQVGVVRLLAQRLSPDCPWIVVAHGSRRPAFAQDVDHLVEQIKSRSRGLQVQVAFLSQSPTLGEQLQYLYDRGYRHLGIQPLLLFPGGLLETLHAQARCYPTLSIRWGSPLAPDPLVIEMIQDLARYA